MYWLCIFIFCIVAHEILLHMYPYWVTPSSISPSLFNWGLGHATKIMTKLKASQLTYSLFVLYRKHMQNYSWNVLIYGTPSWTLTEQSSLRYQCYKIEPEYNTSVESLTKSTMMLMCSELLAFKFITRSLMFFFNEIY